MQRCQASVRTSRAMSWSSAVSASSQTAVPDIAAANSSRRPASTSARIAAAPSDPAIGIARRWRRERRRTAAIAPVNAPAIARLTEMGRRGAASMLAISRPRVRTPSGNSCEIPPERPSPMCDPGPRRSRWLSSAGDEGVRDGHRRAMCRRWPARGNSVEAASDPVFQGYPGLRRLHRPSRKDRGLPNATGLSELPPRAPACDPARRQPSAARGPLGRARRLWRWHVTTLDTLGTATPNLNEVSDASLAMADFDAKRGDLAGALDWLAVAAHHRTLDGEYRQKKEAWELALREPATWEGRL